MLWVELESTGKKTILFKKNLSEGKYVIACSRLNFSGLCAGGPISVCAPKFLFVLISGSVNLSF